MLVALRWSTTWALTYQSCVQPGHPMMQLGVPAKKARKKTAREKAAKDA
jgi:hypothetical protein